jgi:hypothetical protein
MQKRNTEHKETGNALPHQKTKFGLEKIVFAVDCCFIKFKPSLFESNMLAMKEIIMHLPGTRERSL